jgi:hypothetical protein
LYEKRGDQSVDLLFLTERDADVIPGPDPGETV